MSPKYFTMNKLVTNVPPLKKQSNLLKAEIVYTKAIIFIFHKSYQKQMYLFFLQIQQL